VVYRFDLCSVTSRNSSSSQSSTTLRHICLYLPREKTAYTFAPTIHVPTHKHIDQIVSTESGQRPHQAANRLESTPSTTSQRPQRKCVSAPANASKATNKATSKASQPDALAAVAVEAASCQDLWAVVDDARPSLRCLVEEG
jgi:hypothetical protein